MFWRQPGPWLILIWPLFLVSCFDGYFGAPMTTRQAATNSQLTSFSFERDLNSALSATVTGSIDQNNIVRVTVPATTDTSALIATFTTQGQRVWVGSTAQTSGVTRNDFRQDVIYKVVAENGSYQFYTVRVEAITLGDTALSQFRFLAAENETAGLTSDYDATIDGTDIFVALPGMTDFTQLVANFTTAADEVRVGTMAQESGVTDNDFSLAATTPLIYRITALDGNYADYNARVSAQTVTQQQILSSIDISPDNQFGLSVALSGDTLAVGEPGNDHAWNGVVNAPATIPTTPLGLNRGAVGVFSKTRDEETGLITWAWQALLKPPLGSDGDQFGRAVAIDDDTIAVGVPDSDLQVTNLYNYGARPVLNTRTTNAGVVYTYFRQNQAWSYQSLLTPPVVTDASDDLALSQFGAAVAIHGDTIVVGAPYESSNLNTITNGEEALDLTYVTNHQSGAAYVFVRNADAWTLQAHLKASNDQTDDHFGTSVDIYGDIIVVGAPGEDSSTHSIIHGEDLSGSNDSTTDAGAAYVFVRDPDTGEWSQQAYLKAINGQGGDAFGSAVALMENRIVVGAPTEGNTESGAAYLFVRSGDRWVQEAYLKAPTAGASDAFGAAVDLGRNRVLIGAYADDDTAANSGTAFCYKRSTTGTWSFEQMFQHEAPVATDSFGRSVSLSGDTAAMGAPGVDISADAGAVIIFN